MPYLGGKPANKVTSSTDIEAGAIDANAIATDAVGAAEIAAGAVGASEIAAGAVTGHSLATMDTAADHVLIYDSSASALAKALVPASSQAVTALNNATVNELVTVGATTTELDAEAALVWDGSQLGVGTASPVAGSVLHSYTTSNDGTLVHEATGGNSMLVIKGNRTANQDIGHLKFTNGASGDLAVFRVERGDANDSGLLKISTYDGGSSNTGMILDKEGTLALPLQPCFRVRNSTAINNETGDSTLYTIIWNEEDFDIGANFSNGLFAAPVSGKYLFQTNFLIKGLTDSHNFLDCMFTIGSQEDIRFRYQKLNNNNTEFDYSGYYGVAAGCITQVGSGETVGVQLRVGGGSKVCGVDSAHNTHFSGFFIG